MPAPDLVIAPVPEITPVLNVAVPPESAVKVTALSSVMFPEKVALFVPVPPIVIVPLLPDWTVMGLAIVNAPLVIKLALLEPDVLPKRTALDALPKGPLEPDGAAAPTIKVPSLMVVVPA